MPKSSKPNILVIWGDDIGISNLSCYSHGLMGYQTPNIDRIAKEGALFTDWYGQQSCTAGRAAFITGQTPVRTGLTKVGLPGAKEGLEPEDPTIDCKDVTVKYVLGHDSHGHEMQSVSGCRGFLQTGADEAVDSSRHCQTPPEVKY